MARLILIADDSPIIQRKAQRILQDEGFEVQTVSNGVAAVKKLPALQPVLVLADVSMPGKDGYEVCEFVKTSEGLRHVPVLLVGSDFEPYDEPRGARVRADGIIKKPFTPHDLIAMVTRLTGPAKAPDSPPSLADTAAAASPEALPGASVNSPTPTDPVIRQGGEERVQLADVEPLLHEGDEGLSMGGPHTHDHSDGVPPDLLEPSLAPNEPFPGFALGTTFESSPEPVLEVAPELAFAVPETGRVVEEPGTQEIGELILPPQLVDLTASEAVTEPGPALAKPTPEPAPEVVPEPVLAGPETSGEVEESSRGGEESGPQDIEGLIFLPQILDLTGPEAMPEPGPVIAEAIPEPAPETAPNVAPALASPEGSREVEESMSRGVEESRPQGMDELTSTSQFLDSSAPQLPDSSTRPDPEWVYKIVQKVVTRMAPPVLAPEYVEELARMLTGEITAELGGVVEHRDLAPESPSPK